MSTSALSRPAKVEHPFRRVAILFAGGPAPAANAVISAAAVSFIRNEIQVVGIMHGYSHLEEYDRDKPLVAGRDYVLIDHKLLRRTRNSQGILLGTARTNPGRNISEPAHLDDPVRSAPLRAVYDNLRSLEVDALISIGGDDTLKTANKFKKFQDRLPAGSKRIPVVHLPKTIDNDYCGIDFTFGYFTAVGTIAGEIRNLLADAEANRAYYLTEAMGRSAGWLAYGAAIAGEASLVMSVEDVFGRYRDIEESVDPMTGAKTSRPIMKVDEVVQRVVRTMLAREKEGKEFGVIVMAEGLAEFLPSELLQGVPRDEHRASGDQPGQLWQEIRQAHCRRIQAPDRQEPQGDGPAIRLRSPLRRAARLRRHARQPIGRRRLSGPGREAFRRRDGVRRRPA